jgi:hypothetical protein
MRRVAIVAVAFGLAVVTGGGASASPLTVSVRGGEQLVPQRADPKHVPVLPRAHRRLKGAFIPIGGMTSRFSLGPFGPPRTRGRAQETSRHPGRSVASRAIVDRPRSPGGPPHDVIPPPPSGDEPWCPVSPDNVQKTGVSSGGQSGSSIVAAEAERVEPRRKMCSRAESEFLCPSGYLSLRATCSFRILRVSAAVRVGCVRRQGGR